MSMELFISDAQDTLSLAVEMYSVYVRATQRNIVKLTALSPSTLQSLKIEKVPLLIRQQSEKNDKDQVVTKDVAITNPFTIMLEIAKACYLEDVLFGKADSQQRTQVSEFVEMVERLSAADLTAHVNTHMTMRMFLVSENITAADIIVFAAMAPHWSKLASSDKFAMPHAFRWIDHIQHLPGMLDQVAAMQLFTAFPTVEEEVVLSKKQLKKAAKAQGLHSRPEGAPAAGEKKSDQKKDQKLDQKPQGEKPQAAASKAEEEKKGDDAAAPKKEKKQKQKPPAPKKAAAEAIPDIQQMDFRVGKIVEVWHHAEREKLYCEKVDIGGGIVRGICSGVRDFITMEEMKDAMVVVACNLKPRTMAGFESNGMVLCGESADGKIVELLTPPEGSVPGDLVEFPGEDRRPPEVLGKKGTEDPKKDPFANVAGKLSLNSEGVAVWKDVPFTIVGGKGVCKVKSLKAGIVK